MFWEGMGGVREAPGPGEERREGLIREKKHRRHCTAPASRAPADGESRLSVLTWAKAPKWAEPGRVLVDTCSYSSQGETA